MQFAPMQEEWHPSTSTGAIQSLPSGTAVAAQHLACNAVQSETVSLLSVPKAALPIRRDITCTLLGFRRPPKSTVLRHAQADGIISAPVTGCMCPTYAPGYGLTTFFVVSILED